MQSKMLLGVLAALFTMCLLFPLAVPKRTAQAPVAEEPLAPPPAGAVVPSDVVNGEWSPAGFGVRMSAPAGWTSTRRRGRAQLNKEAARPLHGNFTLVSLPNTPGTTIETLLEAHRAEFAAKPHVVLESIAIHTAGTREIVRIEYRETPARSEQVHCVTCIWLSGPQQMELTFTAGSAHWPAVAEVCQASLASLDFGPRSRL